MIRRRTVFILGAGASAPYQLPVGSELVDQICKEIMSAEPIITRLENFLERNNGIAGDAARFAAALKGSRAYSIDAFLETNRPYRLIGKAAIADVLLRAENVGGLAPSIGDWYRYLFSILLSRTTDRYLQQAKLLTIVTFNFDRSFERALFLALKNTFGLTVEQARQLTTELPIYHVHGVLGEPDWLYPDHPNGNPYGIPDGKLVDDPLEPRIAKAVKSIKIVDDEIPEDITEDVQDAISKAQEICLLGFGFDERNLERLGMPQTVTSAQAVRATCYGKTGGEQQPIKKYFQNRSIHLYTAKCYDFMRDLELLSE
jgi:hypothetical protein